MFSLLKLATICSVKKLLSPIPTSIYNYYERRAPLDYDPSALNPDSLAKKHYSYLPPSVPLYMFGVSLPLWMIWNRRYEVNSDRWPLTIDLHEHTNWCFLISQVSLILRQDSGGRVGVDRKRFQNWYMNLYIYHTWINSRLFSFENRMYELSSHNYPEWLLWLHRAIR